MLIGPAAAGKTFLCEQLAQLLKLPFNSISCTMGMSESQLTGWLLPVKKAGRFGYVPAPFVRSLQMPSVFLLDEVDGADPNVLMLLNSVMSNGFITIPQKMKSPTIRRHVESILVAGANTTGSGADDVYSARAALDGATIDRFYPFVVSYDEHYEASLFKLPGAKAARAPAGWKPSEAPIAQADMDNLHSWFTGVRAGAKKAKMQRIVSTRMAQRLVSAVVAGVPVAEVKRDLLTGWSADELARVEM
jgi:MoxR-like ATPase